MIIKEAHEQISPEDEMCEVCIQCIGQERIPAYTEYYYVFTYTGDYNLCQRHYHELATLQ